MEPPYFLTRSLVEQGVTIGANATIVCGHTLGQYALIGAGPVVSRDVPPHALIVGVPGRQADWVCKCSEILARAEEIGRKVFPRCRTSHEVSSEYCRRLEE